MKLKIISDTHNTHNKLNLNLTPDDILIHAGDAMTAGKHPQEILEFAHWWNNIPNEKYIVPGNHDKCFQANQNKYWKEYRNMVEGLKIDQEVNIGNTKIWFSPWCTKFREWGWMQTEEHLKLTYQNIPKDTNILVSHGPPFGILDKNSHGLPCGSPALSLAISNLPELKLVICGHIHESRGYMERGGILYVNASNCGIPYSNFTSIPYNVIYDTENNKVWDIL